MHKYANAVYHKSYELDKPIEVQIWPDRIEILSFPGPVPPVNAEILASHRRIVARDYRNRRIGDFLKELHLTEGRGTGVPKIYGSLERNGSPKPILEYIVTSPRKSKEIFEDLLGITSHTKNKQKYLNPLIEQEWVELTIKDNPKDRNQKYRLTEKGSILLKLLK